MNPYTNKFLFTFAIFFILFKSIDVSSLNYLILFTIAWGLFISNFWINKNHIFFNSLLIINLGIYISFILSKWIKFNSLKIVYQDIYIQLISLAIIVAIGVKFSFQLYNTKNPITQIEIYPKRKKDLENILYYIEEVNIVGINSSWGTGKSFIVDSLKSELKSKYEIIEIDLLACNFNEMQAILIAALEDVLYRNGIMPKFANKIKSNIVKTTAISKFQDLGNLIFNNNIGNSELFLEFKKELKKLDKKILVIFEDIDRISDKNVITDVFAIAEKLSDNNLKIIYQYDEKILMQLEYDTKFLEKYIPFKVNLTDLHFKEIIKFELENDPTSILTIDNFDFLWQQEYRFDISKNNSFQINHKHKFIIDYFPIRIIKHMLIELNMALKDNKELYENNKAYLEVIIGFYVLKHLFPNSYNEEKINNGLLESLYFKTKVKNYSVKEFVNNSNQEIFHEIFSINDNIDTYKILKLFNYQIIIRDRNIDDSHYYKLQADAINYNEKVDRIIRNLMYRGTSALTDMEYAVKIFIDEVLEADIEEQQNNYSKFMSHLNHLDTIIDDQTTIIKMGVPVEPLLFKAFEIINKDPEKQLKLIDFYFNSLGMTELDSNTIKCLNYCPLNSKSEFLKILDYIKDLKVNHNFEHSTDFLYFLKKYMQAFSRLGIDGEIYEYFDDFTKFNTSNDQNYLFEKFKNKFTEIKLKNDKKGIGSFIEDINTIIQFFIKLSEIINHKNSEKVNYSGVETSINISRENLKKFDKIKESIEKYGRNIEIFREIDEAYTQGELSFYHVIVLLEIEPSSTENSTTED